MSHQRRHEREIPYAQSRTMLLTLWMARNGLLYEKLLGEPQRLDECSIQVITKSTSLIGE